MKRKEGRNVFVVSRPLFTGMGKANVGLPICDGNEEK